MTTQLARSATLEVDFQNKIINDTSARVLLPDGREYVPTVSLSGEMMDRFKEEALGEFWHTENDQIQALFFYSDNYLYCQRKKKKFDFAQQQQVYSTYTFTGYTEEQVIELEKKVRNFITAQNTARLYDVEARLQKIDEEFLFFESTWLKRMNEKNSILAVTDWRMSPDVEEKYEGERDLWVRYRQEIRNLKFGEPRDYPTPLDFFRAIKTFKFPIDPKFYREAYPDGLDKDGNAVAYLSTDDQWVSRDTDSSRDLIESRLTNISTMRQNYLQSKKVVSTEVKEMMKLLRLEDFVEAGIDYTQIYTEEDVNDLVD